jgi:hypothetical protein
VVIELGENAHMERRDKPDADSQKRVEGKAGAVMIAELAASFW